MIGLLALFSKEIRQHGFTFVGLAVFTLLYVWALFNVLSAGGRVLSYLSLTSMFATSALLVIALVVGQRLIVNEYYGRTQRFIESLPINRGRMEWVKFLVGYVLLLGMAMGVWLISINLASANESLPPRFLMIMGVRLGVYVFTLWSVVFTVSLLGRLRIPLLAVSVLVLVLMDTYTPFEMDRYGPFALIAVSVFPFERYDFPLAETIESMVLGGGVLAFGFLLARLREGSIVETLASPMSTRDRSFLFVLIVVAAVLFSYLGPDPEEEPFRFTDPAVIHSASGIVHVAFLEEPFEDDAQRLAIYLDDRVSELWQVIERPAAQFDVRVVLAPVARASEFRTLSAEIEHGVVVSANFEEAPHWQMDYFGAFVIHQILTTLSKSRATLETRHWLLDGFAEFWAAHGATAAPELSDKLEMLMLQALYASEIVPVSERSLRDWDSTTDTLGDTLAMALAYSGWRILQEEKGHDALMALAMNENRRPVFGDVRDWWFDWREPANERFTRATGLNWEVFVKTWSQRLVELSREPIYRNALAGIPRGQVTITPERSDEGAANLQFRLMVDEPPAEGMRCYALHRRLPPFAVPVGRAALEEVVLDWPVAGASTIEHVVRGTYGSGAHVYAALECDMPPFYSPIRLGMRRLIMP